MGDVDELLCAGDAVYQFRFSNEVMQILRERDARYILGNHEDVLLGKWGEHARAADWVRTRRARRTWPRTTYQLETTLSNGKTLVMVHGSPWEPYNEYIYPNSPAISRLGEIDADYVILGHTHYQMAERVGRSLIINPGSAGEPRDARNHFQLSYADPRHRHRRSDVRRLPRPDARRRRSEHHPRRQRAAARPNGRDERTPTNTNFWTPD